MSFVSESRERTRPTVPLAAMVDIMFLLLIFFMTASVFRERELQIPVDLTPTQTAEAGTSPATQITISITKENRIFLGQRELPLPTLGQTLEELAEQFPNEAVVIRGDQASRFGLAVRVMDVAQQAGLTNVSVATARSVEDLQ